MFPHYDAQWNGEPSREYINHFDMDVAFPLLGVKLSFKWRPRIEEDVLTDIAAWPLNAPTFLLLGKVNKLVQSNVFNENVDY